MTVTTSIRFDHAGYRRRGYATVAGLYGAQDIEAMRREGARLWEDVDLDRPDVHWRKHATLGRIADRLDPVMTRSAMFNRIAHDPAMLSLTAEIVGGPAFVLKDKLIMKRPGTSGYGVHQDHAYWDHIGLSPDQVLTVMIALDDATPAHGPLEIYPGLQGARLPPHPEDPLDVDPAALEGHEPYVATIKAGDAVFFHALAPHASGPNRADSDRRIYLVTYARDLGDAAAMRALYNEGLAVVHKAHRPDHH